MSVTVKGEWLKAMINISQIMEGQTMVVVSPTDLREFALCVADEVRKAEVEDNRLYTATEFAKLHSVDVSTLWRWRKAGVLKATKIGGNLFYKECDLKKETV